MMRATAAPWAISILFAGVPLAGCDGGDPGSGTVVIPAQPTQKPAPLPTPSPIPGATVSAVVIAPNGDRIEKLALPPAPPPADTAPAAKMRTRKGFTDPPLPPELRDDGGLKPLPPSGH